MPRLHALAAALPAGLLLATTLAACAPADEAADTAGSADPSASSSSDPSASASGSAEDPAACAAAATLRTAGTLTIGTDSPAYEPWFSEDDPTNGEGFESAVAYEVANRMGFAQDAVTWVTVPFNSSYAPGPKTFDLDINQISITPERQEVVDFSEGYYSASQAVIALADSPAAGVTSVADLAGLRLGAQTGTTSLTAIRDQIQPDTAPSVFEDTNAAKQALLNDQVDAIVADLPTAFYITAVEIPKASIVGQFEPQTGQEEEFGFLLEKGSDLTACVDLALDEMKADGSLDALQQQWLSETVDVPVLQ